MATDRSKHPPRSGRGERSKPGGTMKEFSIGGVIGDTIENIRDRFGFHLAYALPAMVLSTLAGQIVSRQALTTQAQPGNQLALFSSPYYWLAMLLGIVIAGWNTTALVGSMLQRRGAVSFNDLIAISIANVGKFIVLYLIWYLAFIVGSILLVVPGLIVVTIWSAAIPAMVDQKLGPWAALQESRRLSKGARWKIFATLLVLLLVMAIPSLVLWGIAGGPMQMIAITQANPLVSGVFTLAMGLLSTIFLSAYFVAIYRRLTGDVRPGLVETFA
ncbi:DUF975 family protein [Novosphingobium sp. JCM 18896]|uniref:DUF975 family protein n=1 Tax=Novosphingobium sp. JCM 18896 TaxID=2989731 RepID=UPI002223078C|nr:DUF975 family protein [Novosphingobium sp. JCM 18896]